MTTCSRCAATWTGYRAQHCDECHRTFSGDTSGDMHRTGRHDTDHGPERRRCLTEDEMRAKGMTPNIKGHWTTGATMPEGLYA